MYPDHCYAAAVAMCMVSTVINLYHSMLFFSVFLLDNHFLCSERNHFLSLIEPLEKKIVSSVSSPFLTEDRARVAYLISKQ